jgi:MHS family proline/betaine transporter-like MFS transporter
MAGAVGNLLEWYDFGLFGYFAPVISRAFFPTEEPLAALLGTFGVFAVGFLMRPLGGVVFGYIGDRWGRKRALEWSVALMAVPTALLGLLPTYAQIGLAAPLFLTLIRVLQGLSVGGEYVGSMSFLVEHADPDRRAFFGSWSGFSVVVGSLLGSGVAALLTGLLSDAQMTAWGWRLPFLLSVGIGGVGLWLRLGVTESPRFLKTLRAGDLAPNPTWEALRLDRRRIAITLGLTLFLSVGYYLPFVWLPTWFAHINQPALAEAWALTANTIALVALMVLTPLMGLISDRIGRKPLILSACACVAFLTYPVFLLMAAGTFACALGAGLVFAFSSSLFGGCMAATLVELFPTRTRYSGVAIGYNTGQAVFGGTAPLVATGLIGLTGDSLSPAFYLSACAAVAGVACLFMKERSGQVLG